MMQHMDLFVCGFFPMVSLHWDVSPRTFNLSLLFAHPDTHLFLISLVTAG